jgi:hypothetical protein
MPQTDLNGLNAEIWLILLIATNCQYAQAQFALHHGRESRGRGRVHAPQESITVFFLTKYGFHLIDPACSMWKNTHAM